MQKDSSHTLIAFNPSLPFISAMGWGLPTWIGGSATPSEPEPARPKSNDGGFVAPDRNAREICYESRDRFFACLDKHDILDAIREDEKSRTLCSQEVGAYERDCARSWVSTDTRRRFGVSLCCIH